jgi:methylated-DNA-protein-cysteine methyltransferase related protein
VDPSAPAPFAEAVVAVLRATRPGDVLSYGEVAREAGYPGAARAVGNLLRGSGSGDGPAGVPLPWWRVVAASGRLAPGHADEQARRLRAEGVRVERGRVAPRSAPAGGRRSGAPRP